MSPRLEALAWLAGQGPPWALVMARVVGLSWTAPALATPGLGGRFRLVLALALTAILAPAVGPEVAAPSGYPALAWALAAELVIGAGLGWSGALVIAGARQAGDVVGAQAGLAPAALFDPEAGEGLTATGHLYGLVALGVFLALGGPSQTIVALAESFRALPPGAVCAPDEAVSWAFGRVGWSLALALRASAPTALALTMAGLALGLLGRAAPSLQLFALSLPARTLIGLTLAMLGVSVLAATLAEGWGGAFPFG